MHAAKLQLGLVQGSCLIFPGVFFPGDFERLAGGDATPMGLRLLARPGGGGHDGNRLRTCWRLAGGRGRRG
eukprot:3994944-Prymnesium_polylepis.1